MLLIRRRDRLKTSDPHAQLALKIINPFRDHTRTVKKKMKVMKNVKAVVASEAHVCVRNWIKVKGKYIVPERVPCLVSV